MATTMKLSKDSVLSQAAFDRYLKLDQGKRVVLTYVWVDTWTGCELTRCKTVVIDSEPHSLADLPISYCGTPVDPYNIHGEIWELALHPVAIFRDPFLGDPNKLVLCETRFRDGKPGRGNNRASCKEVMEKAKDHEPWFGIEQEYYITEIDKQIVGWPKHGYPAPLGPPQHCGVGAERVVGRYICDAHAKACLHAGVKLAGTNAEAILGQWEFQIGPCVGIDAGDHLWMARFILVRMAEDFGVAINFKPRPVAFGDWLGSGAHCNFSTKATRTPVSGIKALEEACEKLRPHHAEHVRRYDPDGGAEICKRLEEGMDKFTWGVGDRHASVRIPVGCDEEKCGYLEDRRPSANADPYVVTESLVRVICLNE